MFLCKFLAKTVADSVLCTACISLGFSESDKDFRLYFLYGSHSCQGIFCLWSDTVELWP